MTDIKYKPWTDEPDLYTTGPTFATIYFHGFLAMCFDGDKQCEVGVNSRASDHHLNVQVRKRGTLLPCDAVELLLPDGFVDSANKRTMNIEVKNPKIGGVYVYTPGSPEAPVEDPVNDRYSYTHYSFDLESDEMHGTLIKKLSDVLWPRFHIDNGLFYTYKVSESDFKLKKKNTGDPVRERIIGLVLAVDIYLNHLGTIEFKCNGEDEPRLKLIEDGTAKYEIAISNSCRTTAKPKVRTEFYRYYNHIIDPSDPVMSDRFELDLKNPKGPHTAVRYGPCDMGDFDFSDPAPCLPVTFGRSSNLD